MMASFHSRLPQQDACKRLYREPPFSSFSHKTCFDYQLARNMPFSGENFSEARFRARLYDYLMAGAMLPIAFISATLIFSIYDGLASPQRAAATEAICYLFIFHAFLLSASRRRHTALMLRFRHTTL